MNQPVYETIKTENDMDGGQPMASQDEILENISMPRLNLVDTVQDYKPDQQI